MLWTIGILLFIAIVSGDSPFLVKDLDKYVKHHVADETRKDKVLDYLKEAQAIRKKTVKANKDLVKQYSKIEHSREATKEDFEKLRTATLKIQKTSQTANVHAIQNSQNYITKEEWSAIEKDIAKSFEKSKKKTQKAYDKLNKQFVKWEAKINKSISDKEKRKQAIVAVERLRTTYVNNKKQVQDELMNHESAIFQYKAPEAKLKEVQDGYLALLKELLDVTEETHFKLVELTTPEEWKKIN